MAPEWFPKYETQYFAGLGEECLTLLPKLARSNNLAVIACAIFVVLVVPMVLGTPRLAVLALVDPRRKCSGKNDAKVGTPSVGVAPAKTRAPHTAACDLIKKISQAPGAHCTRKSPLPLLPSGPGGVGGNASRGTDA